MEYLLRKLQLLGQCNSLGVYYYLEFSKMLTKFSKRISFGEWNPNFNNCEIPQSRFLKRKRQPHRCSHGVDGCHRCNIIPINKDGKIVTHLVEHINSRNKVIKCTIGNVTTTPHMDTVTDVGTIPRQISESSSFRSAQTSYDLDQAANSTVNSKHRRWLFDENPSDESSELTEGLKGRLQEMLEQPPVMQSDSVPTSISFDSNAQEIHNALNDNTDINSQSFDVSKIKSTTGKQLQLVQERLETSVGRSVFRTCFKSISALVTFIIGVQYDTCLEAIITRSVSFLDSIIEEGVALKVYGILVHYVSGLGDMARSINPQDGYAARNGEINAPEMLSSEAIAVWETLKQGIFTKHMSYIIGTVFAVVTCNIRNIKFEHTFMDNIMKASKSDSIDAIDLIDHAVKLFNWISTVGVACFEQRSINPMLMNSSLLAKCHEKYYYWLKRFEEIQKQTTPDADENQRMYLEMGNVTSQLQQFAKYNRDKFSTLQASSLYKECITLFSRVRDYVCKIDAVQVAFGVHLWGQPKVGKSQITPLVHEQICLARGIEYAPGRNAQLNLQAQFQDEIDNSTQTITCNETLPTKVTLSAQSAERSYATALALVDSCPWHPNRANLEEKARITAQHVSVISSANTEEPYLNVASTPGAWTRRYLSVEMKVKPEFANDVGEMVESLTDDSGDYHIFNVYRICYPSTTANSSKKNDKIRKHFMINGKESSNLNTQEFLELLRTLAIDHFSSEDRQASRRKQSRSRGCLTCKRIRQYCVCNDAADYVSTKKEIESVLISEFQEPSMDEESTVKESVQELEEVERRPHNPFGPIVTCGQRGKKCVYNFLNTCSYCHCAKPVNQCEGLLSSNSIPGHLLSIATKTCMQWVNPFSSLRDAWWIDRYIWDSTEEDLIKELEWIPDEIGVRALSLVPSSWTHNNDGSKKFLGKLKDNFIFYLACDKQIFTPFRTLLKRSFTLAVCVALWTLGTCFSWFRHIQMHTPIPYYESHTTIRYHWKPIFPQYSDINMSAIGAYRIFLDGKMDLERLADDICPNTLYMRSYWCNVDKWYSFLSLFKYFGWDEVTIYRWTIVWEKYDWWMIPIVVFFFTLIISFLYMYLRRQLGIYDRYQAISARANHDIGFQRELYDRMRRQPCEYNAHVPTAVGVIGVIVSGLYMWNSIRNNPEVELNTTTNKTWSDWFSWNRKVPKSKSVMNMSAEETRNSIGKNLIIMRCDDPDNPKNDFVIRGIILTPGVIMFPLHFMLNNYLEKDSGFVEYRNTRLECNGVKFKSRIYSASCVQIKGKDMLLYSVPTCPKIKKSLDVLLPTETGTDCHKATIVFKTGKEGKDDKGYDSEVVNARYSEAVYSGQMFIGRGLTYTSEMTKSGYCGSPLVSDKRDGIILGFHTAGNHSGTKSIGYAQEITYSQYHEALEQVKKKWSHINVPHAGNYLKPRMGYEIITGPGKHPATKIFDNGELDPYNCMEILGHNTNLAKYRSMVKKTIISDSVDKYCGTRNSFKAPDMSKPWIHHNKALTHVADRAYEVPPDSLEWACNDIMATWTPRIKEYRKQHPEKCRVLSQDEAVYGIHDSRFMRHLNMKSSIGPVSKGHGPKNMSDLFEEIMAGENEEKRFIMSQEAKSHYNYMINLFSIGEKYGVWAKTCLKDEVVDEDSEKCRIFYILECLFAVAVRQYYLPIIEFISSNPILTETAVGINCASKDWDILMEHVHSFAEDGKITDWDYSKYDLRRSPDVTIASLNILRKIGELFGYDDESLKIMDGIADELRNPVVNWNGTIILMYLWSSGNSLTVYVNSSDNIIHLRVSYHWNGCKLLGKEKLESLGRFNENERCTSYGDDGKSSCRKELRPICAFYAKKRYFDFVNMKITDAAKSDNPQDVVDGDDSDFLKRKNNYIEEINCNVGALSKNSIWKMAHMSISKESPEEIAINAVNTMLLEMFLHGREEYEHLRRQLQKVCKEHNLWTTKLDEDFDARVLDWNEKYAT